MLDDVLEEMMSLTKVDSFCRDYFLKNGSYMESPTTEEVIELLKLWGKLDDVMSEEDLSDKLKKGALDELKDIFSRESLFFEDGKDINILTSNRYFKMMSHEHDYFEIESVLDGSAIHESGGKQIYLKKGDIVLIPPHAPHITQPVDSSTIVNLEIRFSTFEKTFKEILSSDLPISSYFKNALYKKGPHQCIILDGILDDSLFSLFALIWKERYNDSYISGKQVIHLTESLLYHLAEMVRKEHIFDIGGYLNEEMYQIRSYMLEHLNTVTLTEISERFHRSTPVISRYIKAHSGKGFSEMLLNMRMERAADMLLSTNMDISQISYSVGYAGESHFITCFRRKYQITPFQYRKLKAENVRK